MAVRTIDVKAAASLIGITQQAVTGLLRRGALEGEKVSGRWRVVQKAARAYAKKKNGGK